MESKKESKHENYLLLGVPKAGKTTYFCSMAVHMQKLANTTPGLKFRYCDNHTSRFIDECMQKLKSQEWPDKTQHKSDKDYSFQLEYEKRILGIHIYTDTIDIIYHDYPGEAFTAAFSEIPCSGIFAADAEDLKKKIEIAKGIFLLLDAKEMFNENNIREMSESLTKMFKHIRTHKSHQPKLAIIFNKAELFTNFQHDDFCRMFKDNYGNSFAWLPPEYKFFTVYPLGSCSINDQGESIPPEEITPKNVLWPVQWMIKYTGTLAV